MHSHSVSLGQKCAFRKKLPMVCALITVLGSYSQAALEHTENGASFLMELKQSMQPKGTPHALQLLRGVQFRGSDRD